MKYEYDLFICFPEKEKSRYIAEIFKSYMDAAELRTFKYPHNLKWGDPLWLKIENAMDNSRAVLLILTKESLDAPGVAREIDMAIAKRKNIYPLFDRYTEANKNHPISERFWRKFEDEREIPVLAQELINNILEIKEIEKRANGIVALGTLAVGFGLMCSGTESGLPKNKK